MDDLLSDGVCEVSARRRCRCDTGDCGAWSAHCLELRGECGNGACAISACAASAGSSVGTTSAVGAAVVSELSVCGKAGVSVI